MDRYSQIKLRCQWISGMEKYHQDLFKQHELCLVETLHANTITCRVTLCLRPNKKLDH